MGGGAALPGAAGAAAGAWSTPIRGAGIVETRTTTVNCWIMNPRNIIHAIARIVVLVPVLVAIIATGTGTSTGSLVGLDGAARWQQNVSCRRCVFELV